MKIIKIMSMRMGNKGENLDATKLEFGIYRFDLWIYEDGE